jgi:hypothetical protein
MLAAVVAAAAAAVAVCPAGYEVKVEADSSVHFPAYSICVKLPARTERYTFDNNAKKLNETILCSAATEEFPCCVSIFVAGIGYIDCFASFTFNSYVDLFNNLAESGVTCGKTISSGSYNNNDYSAVRCSAAESTDAPATDAPPPPSPSPSPDGDDSDSGMSTGEIVGISFGAVVGVVLAGTAIAAA